MQKAKNNFHSTYISKDSTFSTKNAKDILLSVLEELSMPSITTDFGGSNPNQKTQASVAQAQETLKQSQSVQQPTPQLTMSQADFDKLPDADPGTVIVKQGPDGKYYYYTADPTKLAYINPVPSAGTKPPVQAAAKVAEAVYDFLHNSILEDNDVIAPIEDLDNPNADSHVAVVKIKVEVEPVDEDEDEEEEEKPKKKKKKKEKEKDEDEEEDEGPYDPLAHLPPLDLSDDVQAAVANAQQGMMPNIRVMPTDMEQIQALRDGPIGTVKTVGVPSRIKGIEEDPYGLSVVGLDNDIALRMM